MRRRGFLLTAGGLAAGGPSLMVPRRARAQAIDIKEVTTPLGIKAWLVEDHSVPVVTLSFSIKFAFGQRQVISARALVRSPSSTKPIPASPCSVTTAIASPKGEG